MKLASLKNGTRDGKLVVVSRDLTRCTDASFLVPTLQAALDGWARIAPHLETLAESLELGSVPAERFHEHDAESPLPRAFQAGEAAGIYAGPRDPLVSPSGVRVTAGVAALVTDLPRGVSGGEAGRAIALFTLSCVTEDGLSACGPVAVTTNELDGLWDGWSFNAVLHVERAGRAEGSQPVAVDFAASVAEAAARQPLRAGAVVTRAGDERCELRLGEAIRIEIKGRDGHSIFGAIERKVEASAA